MKLVENHNQTVFSLKNFVLVIAVHVIALGIAPWLFSWSAFLFSFAIMLLFAYSMGIFHHMLLTHRSFSTVRWVENLGSLLGTLTWRGPFSGPVQYVAMHRVHHAYTDTELDPHTPSKGLWHAWMGWFWQLPFGFSSAKHYDTHAPDVLEHRWHVFLDRNVDLVQLVWGGVCFLLGACLPLLSGGAFDATNGLRYVVYGVFVKTLMLWYLANAVDVINHTIGYRNYETNDTSTNSFLMAFLHGGGTITWHNNHHAYMDYFMVKKNWWEFDMHYQFLRFLGLFGLVWDIKVLDLTQPATAAPRNAA